jgi:hypothetical protein
VLAIESIVKPVGFALSCTSSARDLKRNAYLQTRHNPRCPWDAFFPCSMLIFQVSNSFNLCLNSLQEEIHGFLLKNNSVTKIILLKWKEEQIIPRNKQSLQIHSDDKITSYLLLKPEIETFTTA